MIANGTHNPAILAITVTGIVLAARSLVRGGLDTSGQFLAKLMLASTAGMIVTSTALYGYFVDGFVRSLLPLSTFLIAPAIGVVALQLERAVARRWTWPYLRLLCGAVAMLPLVLASVNHFRPPVAADLFDLLQTEYRGRTIIAPNPGPYFAVAELAFALTGGRAFRTSDVDATPDDVVRFDSLRDSDGTLTYLCLDTVYLRWMASPDAGNYCDLAVDRMVPRGHQVVGRGVGWVIMAVNREDGSVTRGREVTLPEDGP
jgi:hypothetical protein